MAVVLALVGLFAVASPAPAPPLGAPPRGTRRLVSYGSRRTEGEDGFERFGTDRPRPATLEGDRLTLSGAGRSASSGNACGRGLQPSVICCAR